MKNIAVTPGAVRKITNVTDARIASNANNANEGGTWYFNPQTTNKPTASGYYVCFVLVRNANNISQTAIEINSGRIFVRTFHDGTAWTDWRELLTVKSKSYPNVTTDGNAGITLTGLTPTNSAIVCADCGVSYATLTAVGTYNGTWLLQAREMSSGNLKKSIAIGTVTVWYIPLQ